MNNFEYCNPAKIIFGKDALEKLKDELKQQNVHSLLMIYRGNYVKEWGIWQAVYDACKELKIQFYENREVVPNPKVELVRRLVAEGREKNIDFVLAVGGGSAIDTAKAVAVGVPYCGDVWDFYSKGVKIEQALPIGVISTLPSSGSETSNCSIISSGLYKLGIEDDHIIPKFAIMNPEFTLSLPQYQTSCGVADILAHLLERYFTDVPHVDTTDYLIEGAIQAVMLNGKRLMKNPKDYNARAEIQWLASIAHNNLLDTGRTGDWASHRIEHELSAQYGITHGEGMAVVLVAYIKYMAEQKPGKLAQLASRVFGVDSFNYSEQEMALQVSDCLREFFCSLHLSTTLSQLSIGEEHFMEMAMRATGNDTSTVGHYFPLDIAHFVKVLKLAL